MQSRDKHGRFQKNTLENLFGIPNNDLAMTALVCVKCEHGSKDTKFLPILKLSPCSKCGNDEGHMPLKDYLDLQEEKTMKDNLQYREELIAGNFQIREENSAFAVYQKSSYFSDSFNPQGEWVNTWNCCATYKTLNNAEKYLEKQIACQFPKGYDISGVLNAIELITEEKEIDAPDSMHYKSKPAESLPDGWHWREYDDGSGALDAPDGKSYFSYDRMTNEYRHPNLQGWSTMGDYQQFKTMAAQWVRDNVVDRGDIAPKSQSSLADRCQAAKEASAKQDNNTPQGGKQHEPNR